jgi:hypothetical protein
VIDLILQELAGLIEQIDRDQPICETADHFVATPPDRRQFTKLVKHPERVDRWKIVAFQPRKELRKQCRRRVLSLTSHPPILLPSKSSRIATVTISRRSEVEA